MGEGLEGVNYTPESWESYISIIEKSNYLGCEEHRKSLNLPVDFDLLTIDCETAICREGCPFESKNKK